MNKNSVFRVICFTFIILLLICDFLYLLVQRASQKKISKNSVSVVRSKTKVILLYDSPDWMEPKVWDSKLDCVVTKDKNYFHDIRMFDALVFYIPTGKVEQIPDLRSPKQYYVFANRESPPHTEVPLPSVSSKRFYNLTLTYRRDSDIYWPYGFITDKETAFISDFEDPNWRSPNFENNNETMKLIETKRKTAAWFVSHCNAPSQRSKIVNSLKKYIDVDIYGSCGNLTCGSYSSRPGKCYELVEQEYYFYFSFENSLCQDYLTEKIFNIMKYYVVPVVYGGANYSLYLPPHSYIDVNNFKTTRDLANYLKYLIQNPTEYVKYFWWKKYYINVVSGAPLDNLCKKLHEFTTGMDGKQLVKSYSEFKLYFWWNTNQCTTKPKITWSTK